MYQYPGSKKDNYASKPRQENLSISVCNTEFVVLDVSLFVKRLGLGLGLGTWDFGPGTWDLGLGTWDLGIESRTKNRESRIETTPSPRR